MKHQERHPHLVEGCFGCKVMNIGMASVPGGTRPGSFKKSWERKFDKDMHAYRNARRAGEQPDTVSVEGVRKNRQRMESIERGRKKIERWQ